MRDSTYNLEVDKLSAKANQRRKNAWIHFQDQLRCLRTLFSPGRISVCCGEDSSWLTKMLSLVISCVKSVVDKLDNGESVLP